MTQNNGIPPTAQGANNELLSEMIRLGGAMSESQAMDYFVRLLDALQFVHSSGKLHLNVAPSNVAVDSNGMIELINSRENENSYNPGYTPMEVMTTNAAAQGPWSDIYGAGATLYNMLTGKQPPETDDIISAGNNAFDFAGVSGLMQQLISKMMSPSRKQRPQSVSDVWEMISNLAEDKQPDSAPPAPVFVPDVPQSTPAEPELPQPAPVMPDVPQPAPAPQPIPAAAPAMPPQKPASGDNGKKKSGNRTGLYILCGVLLIAAIAGAAVMLWQNSGKTTDKIENTADASPSTAQDNIAATTNTDTAINTDSVANEEPAKEETVEPTNNVRQNNDAAAKEAQKKEAQKKAKAEADKKAKAEAEKKRKADERQKQIAEQKKKQQQNSNTVLEVAPVMPSYPDGENKIMDFINRNKKNPTGETGFVVVKFVVNKNGSLSNFKVVKSMSPQHDQEALRVCKMLPNFKPGRDEYGNPVSVYRALPIRF